MAAWNSGDLERILATIDPEFEGHVPPELSAEPDTYRGHEGLVRYFSSFYEAMEEVRFEAERFWEAGASVVADVRVTAKGRSTEIMVEQRIAQVWTLREGAVLRVISYPTLAQALQAAGLPPPGDVAAA
jgi:ketosteroid isomerase-like protein